MARGRRTMRDASATSQPSRVDRERDQPGPAVAQGVDGVGVPRVLDDDAVAAAEQGAQDEPMPATAPDAASTLSALVGSPRSA